MSSPSASLKGNDTVKVAGIEILTENAFVVMVITAQIVNTVSIKFTHYINKGMQLIICMKSDVLSESHG